MSSARPAPMQQSLVISLIIFVTLTFILLIVTYFAYSQGEKARLAAEESRAAAETATRERNAARDGLDTLRALIGVGEGEADAEKIKERIDEELAKNHPEFQEDPKTLLRLAAFLRESREAKDAELKTLEAAKKAAQTDFEKAKTAESKAEDDRKQATKAAEEKVAERDKANSATTEDFTKTTNKLTEERLEAQSKAEAMTLLTDEIRKGEKEVGEKAFEKLDPIEQVRALLALIRRQQSQIEVLEKIEILRMVAGADPKIQNYVLQAIGATARDVSTIEPLLPAGPRPSAQRIDGRVIAVDDGERTVVVEAGFTFDAPPGLVLQVFSGSTPVSGSPGMLPAGPVPKGTIEVVSQEGLSRLRCRIQEDSLARPILVGDYVASPLWEGSKRLNAVLVGWVDLDGDAEEDSPRLKEMITRAGGSVSDAVSEETTLVVDASGGFGDAGEESFRRKLTPAMKTRRDLQLKNARRFNVPRTSVEELRYWLGDTPRPPSEAARSFAAPTPPPAPSVVAP
jgi:hypothetical protein